MTDWTAPRTWNTAEFVTKPMLDEQIRDNSLHLKEQVTLALDQITFFGTPLDNPSYDGDVVTVGSTNINAHTFNANIPTTARALIITLSVKWASASDANYCNICHGDASTNGLVVRSQVANVSQDGMGIVPLSSSGEFKLTVGGANTLSTYVKVGDILKAVLNEFSNWNRNFITSYRNN